MSVDVGGPGMIKKMTAVVAGEPVARVSCGGPVTFTGSLNATVTGTTWPTVYEPFAKPDVTFVTVGAVVSITIALFAPSEPAAPGDANVNVALFVAASVIVPPFRANEVVVA